MILVLPAEQWEAEYVGDHLRPEDRREVEASSGTAASVVVPRAFSISSQCYSMRYRNGQHVDAQPYAIFGVAPDQFNPQLGIVWLLATPNIRKAWLSTLKCSSTLLDLMSQRYPAGLHNLVDMRNTLHMRWLKLTGFTLGKVIPLNGQRFIHAHRLPGARSRV